MSLSTAGSSIALLDIWTCKRDGTVMKLVTLHGNYLLTDWYIQVKYDMSQRTSKTNEKNTKNMYVFVYYIYTLIKIPSNTFVKHALVFF